MLIRWPSITISMPCAKIIFVEGGYDNMATCVSISEDKIERGDGGECEKMLRELEKKYGKPRREEWNGGGLGASVYIAVWEE